MTTPSTTPAAAVAAVEAAAKAEAVSVWSKVKAFALKYWPVAAGVAIAATRFL